MAGQLTPHTGMCAWARPLNTKKGAKTERGVYLAVAPSPYPLEGMHPRPQTPSSEIIQKSEQVEGEDKGHPLPSLEGKVQDGTPSPSQSSDKAQHKT